MSCVSVQPSLRTLPNRTCEMKTCVSCWRPTQGWAPCGLGKLACSQEALYPTPIPPPSSATKTVEK